MSELMKRMWFVIAVGMASSAVQATDLNLTGTVVATPCTVDTGSVSQDVDFGQLRATDLTTAGNASPWMPFEVKLVNCPVSTTSAKVTFSGTRVSTDATLFANAGSAINAAVQMAQAANKSLVQGDGSSMTVAVDALHKATYALAGRVISTGNTGPGTFRSVVQMSFTYQ
ncbi:MAG: fimbrial protein [Serratia sp. (in: enterobacteria)]|uniref:fimbrial protein n=1 Tax=Serratia sp. (in: enterobacteria) TaxID=616 RepID=UPI003F2A7EE9